MRWPRLTLSRSLLLALLLAVPAVLWWHVYLNPANFEVPQAMQLELEQASYGFDENGKARLFVFGTLRNPAVRMLVTGSRVTGRPGALSGYRRVGLDIVEDESASVSGLVLTVNERQLRRLDRYERLGQRYRRFVVTLEDGGRAWVYQRIRPEPDGGPPGQQGSVEPTTPESRGNE
ncbi:MAG TPA: gamma-glutamylcyclotransferase [Pseudohongiella sp.]|nr:gamma-glutamylcyclotransferase [Pseudohongiella sp.]